MKKWIGIAIAVVLGVPILFFGAIYAASELGGEVVVLHRPAPDGSTSTVRIWIVEDDDGAWVEHGSADAAWIQRLAEDARIELERGGAAGVYHAVPDPDAHAHYHALRRAKYGWADSFIESATGDTSECPGVPVRLEAPRTAGVTLGGTPAEGEVEGLSAMFVGDRFENFRNMDRFGPTSVMTASPEPWNLGPSQDRLRYGAEFLGNETSLEDFIEISDSSALLVMQDGEVIYERYAHGDSRESLHTSFSVAKSFTSALVGIALGEGLIESLDDPIRRYLPELTSPTLDGVSIRHVLQMSSGIRFDETYTDPASDINRMFGLIPPMTYLEYINTLERDQEPGTFNHYASINTQLLGILLVRLSGESLTDYMTQRLWHPLGMEQKGLWTLDEQGYELAMGGLAASARDYAKLGLLYLEGGMRGEKRLLPEGWAEESVTPNQPHLMPGDNPASSNTAGYMYQWWTPRGWDGDFLARGIWGQTILVHPKSRVVIVKLAADQKNFDLRYKLAYIDYLQALAQSLVP